MSGVLDLAAENCPLYIASDALSGFGSSMGPQDEHTIIKRIGAVAPFGSTIRDSLMTELDYFVGARESLKRFDIRLVNARGHVVPLNGAEWSMSLVFQELNE